MMRARTTEDLLIELAYILWLSRDMARRLEEFNEAIR